MLSAGAGESSVTGFYDKGILTVRIPVREPETSERRIEVEH
jgi:HSP20 family molecular chaperone IbpA